MYNHISVDLDYFQNFEPDKSWTLYQKIKKTGKPIYVFLEHQHVLEYINKRRYERIINIDYHDDVIDNSLIVRTRDKPEDYDWVNFYKYRTESVYEWRHPHQDNFRIKGFMRIGRCCDEDIWYSNHTDWKEIEHHRGLRSIFLEDARDFSIIVSPKYTVEYSVLQILSDIFNTNNMTYIIEKMEKINDKWLQVQ